jgi:uncharacterized protein
MRRPEIENFIAISLPVSRFNFGFFSPRPISGLVIQGSEDEISQPFETTKLVRLCQRQKSVSVEYKIIENADHFYTEYITELDEVLNDYIQEKRAEDIRAEDENFFIKELSGYKYCIGRSSRQESV